MELKTKQNTARNTYYISYIKLTNRLAGIPLSNL